MQTTAAALTMVRDDAFFLKAWLRHYGAALGRENCTIINHGRGEEVARLAEGCNIIGIPGDPHPNFDMKRWRLLNNLVQGLRCYYDHVIVGDVDELVVVDPAAGVSLLDFLRDQPIRTTPRRSRTISSARAATSAWRRIIRSLAWCHRASRSRGAGISPRPTSCTRRTNCCCCT